MIQILSRGADPDGQKNPASCTSHRFYGLEAIKRTFKILGIKL